MPGTWDRMVCEIYLVNVSIQCKGNDAHYNIIHVRARKLEIIGIKYCSFKIKYYAAFKYIMTIVKWENANISSKISKEQLYMNHDLNCLKKHLCLPIHGQKD